MVWFALLSNKWIKWSEVRRMKMKWKSEDDYKCVNIREAFEYILILMLSVHLCRRWWAPLWQFKIACRAWSVVETFELKKVSRSRSTTTYIHIHLQLQSGTAFLSTQSHLHFNSKCTTDKIIQFRILIENQMVFNFMFSKFTWKFVQKRPFNEWKWAKDLRFCLPHHNNVAPKSHVDFTI